MSVKRVKHNGKKLKGSDLCLELYRIYPNGKEWFCGYFRAWEDICIELERMNHEESGPDEYVIKEVPSNGIPLRKIHDIAADRKRWAEEDAKRAIEAKKWEEERKKALEEWEREEADWHTVVAWGKTADVIESLGVHKGMPLFIEGSLSYRSWNDQNGQKRYSTDVIIETFQLLGSRQFNTSGQQPAQTDAQPSFQTDAQPPIYQPPISSMLQTQGQPQVQTPPPPEEDDDLPF